MDQLDTLYERLCQTVPGLELRRNELMSRHTTFRVGGPAALMALPTGETELVAAMALAAELEVSPLVIGNGSNLLVDDEGLRAFVVKTAPGLCWCGGEGNVLTAQAGVLLSRLSGQAAQRGLTGLEFAHGIPGSLGGGIFMNAGAYGGELSQVVSEVRVMDGEGNIRVLPASACRFSYRHSAFADSGEMILSASLTLLPGDREDIWAHMAELAAKRREKQPLEYPSAGSTFKRPLGHFAAVLIDQCGLRGLTVGGAQVSPKHAGFVINTGGATCRDILTLIDQVRERVFQDTGVELEPEVRYLR